MYSKCESRGVYEKLSITPPPLKKELPYSVLKVEILANTEHNVETT